MLPDCESPRSLLWSRLEPSLWPCTVLQQPCNHPRSLRGERAFETPEQLESTAEGFGFIAKRVTASGLRGQFLKVLSSTP